jgi:hypothetical protein
VSCAVKLFKSRETSREDATGVEMSCGGFANSAESACSSSWCPSPRLLVKSTWKICSSECFDSSDGGFVTSEVGVDVGSGAENAFLVFEEDLVVAESRRLPGCDSSLMGFGVKCVVS